MISICTPSMIQKTVVTAETNVTTVTIAIWERVLTIRIIIHHGASMVMLTSMKTMNTAADVIIRVLQGNRVFRGDVRIIDGAGYLRYAARLA